MSSDLPEIEEMSVPESAWVEWKHSQDVDTGGLCDCGHEGLGIGWHSGSCPGATFALVTRVQKLIHELHAEWISGHENLCGGVDDYGTCIYVKRAGDSCHHPLPPSLQH